MGGVCARFRWNVAGFFVLFMTLVGLAVCTPPGPPGNISGIERVVYLPPPGAGGDAAAEARERARLIQDRPQQFRVNDDPPSDNSGSWGILLTVDERNAN